MVRLIEAPDLSRSEYGTKRGKRTRLIEAPDLIGSVQNKVKSPIPEKDYGPELASLHKDIAKLNKAMAKIVRTEFETIDTIENLTKERQALSDSLNKLNDRVKEISSSVSSNLSSIQRTTGELREDVNELIDELNKSNKELKRLDKKVEAEAMQPRYYGGGIGTAQAVAAVKADGGIVLTTPPEGMKKVQNIYFNPDENRLVVVYKGE